MADASDPALAAALAQLRSADVATQNRGVEAMLRLGPTAAPALRALLGEVAAPQRAQAMYALAQLGLVENVPVFEHGLDDRDEQVRSNAALGLFKLRHPGALAACLRTLDDAADIMHGDMTPSVECLGQLGLPAVPPLLDRMMSRDATTRLHARRALERIVDRRHGFVPGRGYPSPAAEAAARAEWRANGDYDDGASEAARAASVAAWRRWLATAR